VKSVSLLGSETFIYFIIFPPGFDSMLIWFSNSLLNIILVTNIGPSHSQKYVNENRCLSL